MIFTAYEVVDVAIDKANGIVNERTSRRIIFLGNKAVIQRSNQLVDKFMERTSGLPAELNILLIVKPPKAFCLPC